VKVRKILLVDDSNTVLLVERMLLGREPYVLHTASDGREAVQMATALRPDLVVMDAVMPGMDGFAACRELRAREETRGIPVILVTARGDAAAAERCHESGGDDYVTKPIDGGELLAKIRKLVD
jgi:CheY-like chemotaxis protein